MSNSNNCQPQIPTSQSGVDGINAYNFTTASFVQPAINANVTISVQSTNPFGNGWFAVGQIIFISVGGYYKVVSITGFNQVTIENLGYSDVNFTPAAPGVTIAPNQTVSPSGLRGPAGSGTSGINGTTRFYYDGGIQQSRVGTPKTIWNLTIQPADLPQNDGDSLLLTFLAAPNVSYNPGGSNPEIGIRFGGSEIFAAPNTVDLSALANIYCRFSCEVIRFDADNAEIRTQITSWYNGFNFSSTWDAYSQIISLNYWSTAKIWEIHCLNPSTDSFKFGVITIDRYTA